MTELEAILQQIIEREGPIPVARFMQLALTHPEHGYYMKGDPLGVAGDFTTAPEVSQMFGELIGIWAAEIWKALGSPSPFVLLELGPGRGTLMQDALRATAKVEGFHQAMRLHLIETNETLQLAQQEKLGAYQPAYLSCIPDLPDLPLIAIANEFLDAMPVHQYVKTAQGWRERLVTCIDGQFAFVEDVQPTLLPLPDDKDFYELSPMSVSVAEALADHIKRNRGAALLIDYGYSEPSGANTLQAVSGHAPVSPLERVGHVDLTAHVDFLALRIAAQKFGARTTPVLTQGAFLKALGIDLRTWQLKMKAGYDQALDLDSALVRLTDPEQMGSLFKVVVFHSPDIQDIPGFP